MKGFIASIPGMRHDNVGVGVEEHTVTTVLSALPTAQEPWR